MVGVVLFLHAAPDIREIFIQVRLQLGVDRRAVMPGLRDAQYAGTYLFLRQLGGIAFKRQVDGVAAALARITKAILNDEKSVLPLSVFQEGQYGFEGTFIGQPAVVGAQGIIRPINLPLNDAELQKMQESAKQLQEIIDTAFAEPEIAAAVKQ